MTTPRKIKTTALVATLVTTLISSATIWAQPTPAQIQMQQQQQVQNLGGMIQSDNMRRCGNPNGCNQSSASGPSAAEIRAWEAREAEVQARIAKHRATLFYMAIAYDLDNGSILPRGGFYSKERAIEEALQQCQSANCRVVAVFANACGVLTFPEQIQSFDDLFFGIDVDDRRAAAQSIRMCEAKHGKDNCFYFAGKTQNGSAFCTGYDYSIYGHR